jgi:hypothetical protein
MENEVRDLSESLDALSAASVDLAIAASYDLAPAVSRLNSRLANDVVVSDRPSDLEARKILAEIRKDTASLHRIFSENGIAPESRLPMPRDSEVETLRRIQAQELASQFRHAFDMYPGLVDRYGQITAAPDVIGERLLELDSEAFPLKDAFDALETMLSDEREAYEIQASTFARMRNFAAGVFQADEALKRLEAASGKRSEPTPSAREAGKVSWGTAVAVMGVVAVSGIMTLTLGGR